MKNSNNYSATPVPKPDIKPVGTGYKCATCGKYHEDDIAQHDWSRGIPAFIGRCKLPEQKPCTGEHCPECASKNIIRKGYLHTKCLVCGWKGLSREVLVKKG